MTIRKTHLFAALAVAALYLGLAPEASAQTVRLESRFTNTGEQPLASGHARYDQQGGNRHLRVEVEDVNLATTPFVLAFLIDPAFTEITYLGHIIIDPTLGFGGEIDLNTTDGATVPTVAQGSYVVILGGVEPYPLMLYGDLQPRP